MKFFNWFKKNNQIDEKIIEEKQVIDYRPLIKIAKILTNDDYKAIESIKTLVNSPEVFVEKYPDWLEEMGFPIESMSDVITAYWLTGYDTPYNFGGYIDWKSETEDILFSLEDSIKKKNYDINWEDIDFLDDDFTDVALFKMSNYLKGKGLVLVNWNTESDSYHIFIIEKKDYDNLVILGKKLNIRFHSFLQDFGENGELIIIEA